MISLMSQKEKDKYCMISRICGILKKHTQTKLIDTESRLAIARGRGGWEQGWVGEMGEESPQVETSSYKTNNLCGYRV